MVYTIDYDKYRKKGWRVNSLFNFGIKKLLPEETVIYVLAPFALLLFWDI